MQGPEASYNEYLAKGEFHIQRCIGCHGYVFYPRLLCPHCGSAKLEWVRASGAGAIYSTTVMRRKPEAGGDYNVCLVELQEGPRLMSRVEGVPPDKVRIGMKVKARVAKGGEEGAFIVFELAGN